MNEDIHLHPIRMFGTPYERCDSFYRKELIRIAELKAKQFAKKHNFEFISVAYVGHGFDHEHYIDYISNMRRKKEEE